MTLDALIFDVDGTLADTEEAHRQSFNSAFAANGLGWHWDRGRYRELLDVTGGKERIRAYIETLDVAPAERRRLLELTPVLHADKTRLFTATVADGALPLRDGVERLLDEALHAGVKLAIATTTSPANVDALLTAALGDAGPARFDVIAAGDIVAAKKPAPDIYRLALRTLGIDADRAIAFEDSRNGLAAARGAGLWTVVTPNHWTEHQDFTAAQLLLRSLAEVSLRDLHGLGERHDRDIRLTDSN